MRTMAQESRGTAEPLPYAIPDFEADDALTAAYETAVKAHVDDAIATAVGAVRDAVLAKTEQLEAAVKIAELAATHAKSEAIRTADEYADKLPNRRNRGGGVRPPSFIETLRTFGAANRLYRAAVEASDRKHDALKKERTTIDDLERHNKKFESTIVAREAEIRKHYASLAGRDEFRADPKFADLLNRHEAIVAERETYDRRYEQGRVVDAEARDRSMARDNLRFLDGTLRGVRFDKNREMRFGALRYFRATDRDGRTWLVDYDDELRPLTRKTVDISQEPGGTYRVERSAGGEYHPSPEDAHHAGRDPRIGQGVDLRVMRALRDFVNRDTTI